MKLLVSAEDLKTSCYIYFIDMKKKFAIITNVPTTQLLHFVAKYNMIKYK